MNISEQTREKTSFFKSFKALRSGPPASANQVAEHYTVLSIFCAGFLKSYWTIRVAVNRSNFSGRKDRSNLLIELQGSNGMRSNFIVFVVWLGRFAPFAGKWSLGIMPFGLKSLGLIQLVTWLNFFKLSVSGIGQLA